MLFLLVKCPQSRLQNRMFLGRKQTERVGMADWVGRDRFSAMLRQMRWGSPPRLLDRMFWSRKEIVRTDQHSRKTLTETAAPKSLNFHDGVV